MTVTLLGLALAVGAPALKDKPKEVPPIVGVWAVESISAAGKVGAKLPGEMKYEFTADGKWLMHRTGGVVGKGTSKEYTVDVKASPPTIDAKTVGSSRPAMAGIYKLEGDTLTICFGPAGGDRPKAFESPDGGRVVLLVLKRVKKD